MMLNYIKYYVASACYNVSLLFTGAAVIQIFLTTLGVDSIPIGIFTSLLSVVNVLTYIVFSPFADRLNPVKRYMSLLCLPMGVCCLLLIPLCFATDMNVGTAFVLTAAICLVHMLFNAMYGVFTFKLPYSIIDIRNYGRFSSIDGIIIGIATTVTGFLLSEFQTRYDYFTVMAVGFAVGGGCMLTSALLLASLKITHKDTSAVTLTEKQSVLAGFGKLLRMKSFRQLIVPNVLRGIHMGMLSVAAVIATACGNTSETVSRVVPITFLGSILGSLIYMLASRRVESRRLCLIGSLIVCVGVLMPFCRNTMFLLVYFVTILGKYIIDYAVPSQVYAMIPADTACFYQTWRMILTTSGSVLSTAVSGVFIEHISITGFLVIASLCQVVCGIGYFCVRRETG